MLEQVGLPTGRDDLVKTYSLGMKQRLGVAAALLPTPKLVILDEPTNGLDPAGIREMRAIMRGLADRGITVFVSSHLLAEIEAICDHLVMIDSGRIVFQGGIDGAARRAALGLDRDAGASPATSTRWWRCALRRVIRRADRRRLGRVVGRRGLGGGAKPPGDGGGDHAARA